MKIESLREKMLLCAIAGGLALCAAPRALAQGTGELCPIKDQYNLLSGPSKAAPSGTLSAAAKIDPREAADYKAFFKLPVPDADKRMEAGNAFVQKYPTGPFSEAVYSQLTTAAYQKQDFEKMDEYADKALALNPDDVTVLVFVGWVIPHSNDSAAKLDKAERYEKHALELLPTLAKPAGMSEKEFALAKSEYESQAHSGMGLVYYQREDFANAVAEMKKATSGASHPDPSDYFVMGKSLDRLDHYSDAVEAFTMCAAIPGGQQALCKQKAEAAKQEAAAKPTAPEGAGASKLSAQQGPTAQ
jgi:tetratricopeptide (TPR) repeat protein